MPAPTDVTVHPQQLSAAVQALFARAGSSATEARLVAEQLVGANLAGHDSHGVGMVPTYIEVLLAGELKLNRQPDTVLDHGALTVLDADLGLGQVAGHAAMTVAIEKARQHGISLTGLRNSHHIGRIGHWAEMACAAGMVSIHFVNVISHPVVAPYGGTDGRLVTNPIAIGVPRPRAEALVLDFATSKLAVGKVRVALNTGKTLPPAVLLDGAGQATRDPAALFDEPRGALLPFGDHKGSGLALMCEILGSALFGGPVMHGKPGRLRIINNMGTIVIDPAPLAAAGTLDAQIAQLLDWVRASPAATPPDGVPPGVQIAGEPETRARRARAAGIPIDAETWRQLTAAAVKVGLDE
ncbi:MAG: malate/lactate/ureidoglycolate dehydrogenase, partial [Rubrivivax sp.]